jgi:hypothetical protein
MDAVFPAQGLQADRSSVRTLLTTRTSRQGIPVKYRLVIFDMDGTLAEDAARPKATPNNNCYDFDDFRGLRGLIV